MGQAAEEGERGKEKLLQVSKETRKLCCDNHIISACRDERLAQAQENAAKSTEKPDKIKSLQEIVEKRGIDREMAKSKYEQALTDLRDLFGSAWIHQFHSWQFFGLFEPPLKPVQFRV